MNKPNLTKEHETLFSGRPNNLSWLAGLALTGGHMVAAEGYLLELLAWCAFAYRKQVEVGSS